MDAKERLRRYLEQRREMGESELVLDSLSVDDVMSMLGAKPGSAAPRANSGGSSPAKRVQPSSDSSRAGDDAASRVDDTPAPAALTPQPHIPALPPTTPEVRFDSGATTDWREALRNAGAAKPADAKTPTPPSESGAAPTQASPVAAAGTAPHPVTLPAWLSTLQLPAGIESGRLRVLDASPDIARLSTLDDLAQHVASCTRCALYKSARHPVAGAGNTGAELLCIGEAPSAAEDDAGTPFVGEAGDLLMKILGAIQLTRDDVLLTNIVKHRPPGNRDPLPDEISACQPYLLRQLELARPRVILALGRIAAQSLLQTTTSIGELRGRVHMFHGVPLIVTYHPAALLLNESWKRPTWEDVKLARRILDASRADGAPTSGQ